MCVRAAAYIDNSTCVCVHSYLVYSLLSGRLLFCRTASTSLIPPISMLNPIIVFSFYISAFRYFRKLSFYLHFSTSRPLHLAMTSSNTAQTPPSLKQEDLSLLGLDFLTIDIYFIFFVFCILSQLLSLHWKALPVPQPTAPDFL